MGLEKHPISASDLERYGYCPLSWKLHKDGVDAEGKGIIDGTKKKREVRNILQKLFNEESYSDSSYQNFNSVIKVAIVTNLIGISLLLFKPVWPVWLFTLGTLDATLIAYFFISLSFLWLIVASLYLYFFLFSHETTDEMYSILDVENDNKSNSTERRISTPKLFSSSVGLCGKPAYVIENNEEMIPVDVKSGRKPEAPFFNHILQNAAYCFLVEEQLKTTVPHGIIRYGMEKNSHTITWDKDLKNLLLEKISEMEKILNGDSEAHRNHNRPGKCKNCSRKEACPERLDN